MLEHELLQRNLLVHYRHEKWLSSRLLRRGHGLTGAGESPDDESDQSVLWPYCYHGLIGMLPCVVCWLSLWHLSSVTRR